MRTWIEFVHRGAVTRLEHVEPTRTVLQYLREDLGLCGTKEGCAEGDCGACTVVLGESSNGTLRFRPVNACIQFLPTLDGKLLLTVEDLPDSEALHPVQRAMVELHGSQCGFCTPGFVMSMAALANATSEPDETEICDALAGNLCRCTGYGPIIDAARRACREGARLPGQDLQSTIESLPRNDTIALTAGERRYFAPADLQTATRLAAQYPDATLLAGGTDVGLWVTKQQRELDPIIYLGRVAELQRIDIDEHGLTIGASVTYADSREALASLAPQWDDLIRRIGATQVWNAGTLGGNIANGSPIGDTPPALIAMGATITLADESGQRVLDLEDFFIDYGKQDRRAGEILAEIYVPRPDPSDRLFFFKISKRFDQDISAVMAACRYRIDDNRLVDARIAFGGMAATPRRALHAEAALLGQTPDEASFRGAMDALSRDFSPIDDLRASARYRMKVARSLILKSYLELDGSEPTRLYGHAEVVDGRR